MLSSCEKNDVYDPSAAKKTTDLVVPDGFDWSTTRDVTVTMTSQVATFVSIYLDEACQQLVAELPVEVGTNSVTLSVPSANSYIWMKYPVKNGGEETQKVDIKKAVATRGSASSWTAESLFPDYAETVSGNVAIYQPNKANFGTIMFEDMWPELGDYDFNDFVVNYKAEITKEQNVVHVGMTLKLRAMGGEVFLIDSAFRLEINRILHLQAFLVNM